MGMTREEAIKQLRLLKGDITFGIASKVENKNQIEALSIAIASLETDEAYQLEYESTTKNDIDFKLKDYVSREAVRRIIKSPRTQEQMLNALNSLRNATECKAEDCINRDYTAKYVEEFANNEYVSQDEAETIYLIADGIRHIPSVLPKAEWIPVTEKLPHDRDWYLGIFKEPDTGWINPLPFICDYVGRETKATTKEYWILRGFTDWDDYHIDYYFNLECVAWMPLPQAYREVEG